MTRFTVPLRGWEARRTLRQERRVADEELVASRRPSPRLAWRVVELVSDEHRIELGRRVTDVVHAADERFLPGASPVDRGAVRECRPQLLEVAARLFDTSLPVTARGVLLVQRLLDGGAVYGNGRAPRLRRDLDEAREALEPIP
jgi:hypothetical protein